MTAAQNMPASFEELIRTHPLPILVDFWADWCGPCRMVAPVLKELAADWKGRVTVIKINSDEKPDIAARYGINSLPTLVLFKGGREVHRVSGALPKHALEQQFARFV